MEARKKGSMEAEWEQQQEAKRASHSLERRYREQQKRDAEKLAAMKDEVERQIYERRIAAERCGIYRAPRSPQRVEESREKSRSGKEADARTRTGDPFITSYGPLSSPVTRSHLRSLLAPDPRDRK